MSKMFRHSITNKFTSWQSLSSSSLGIKGFEKNSQQEHHLQSSLDHLVKAGQGFFVHLHRDSKSRWITDLFGKEKKPFRCWLTQFCFFIISPSVSASLSLSFSLCSSSSTYVSTFLSCYLLGGSFIYWAHVTSLTCKANVQSTKTSHTWIDFVYTILC